MKNRITDTKIINLLKSATVLLITFNIGFIINSSGAQCI